MWMRSFVTRSAEKEKAMRNWVVDASPLILLAKIDHQHLLKELPDLLVIPEPVAQEIEAGPSDDPARQWLHGRGKDFIRPIEAIPPSVAAWDLGKGERAVLSWAFQRQHQHPGWTAFVDDLAARRCAHALNLSFSGTIGVVLAAKKAGAISDINVVLNDLMNAGFRISLEIVYEVLKGARSF